MPEAFGEIKKHCEKCGRLLVLKNTRDIKRKRFCSRQCLIKTINPGRFVKKPSEETRQKMRDAKLRILAQGWKPTGWKKYDIPTRLSNHHDYLFKGNNRLHRLIAEQALGRKLTPGEIVHHKDENKLNNNLNNLEILSRSDHMKIHTQRRTIYASQL